jgi:trans-2,3-dihydro-3-hydroxyanthranilate isomerase
MLRHRYLHYDVFTRRPLAGNQLAVFPDATGLSTAVMQRIALEMAFPETTFILPPETGDREVRMRIFTPRRELPMAGHPTIGSTFALAREGVIAPGRGQVVFALGIGPTPVSLEWAGEELAFAWMHQPLSELGPLCDERDEVAAALGLEPQHLHTGLPVQVVSSGLPVLFVPIRTRAAVDAVTFELARLRPLFTRRQLDDLPVFAFSLEEGHDDATAYSRMFAPAFGITEDPATGGASGPLGVYLVHHGAVSHEAAGQMVSLQGVKMGRPSRVHIAVGVEGGVISSVRVGGASVLVAEGELYL